MGVYRVLSDGIVGGVLSVRSCRVQQMLFVAAQAIVIESWDWLTGIGSSSWQQEDISSSRWLSATVSQSLVPPTGPPFPGRRSWCKVWATLSGRGKLVSSSWRSLRDRRKKQTTAIMKLCRTFLGSYLSLVSTEQQQLQNELCVSESAALFGPAHCERSMYEYERFCDILPPLLICARL